MRSTTSTTLTLPPFRGAVRRIILANLVLFFALAILSFSLPKLYTQTFLLGALSPTGVLHGFVWQLFTFSFMNTGLLGTAFGLLFLWFAGSQLEDARGGRWLTQLYYVSTVTGALLAVLIAGLPLLTGGRVHFFLLGPNGMAAGLFAPLFAVLVAFGLLYAEMEILFFFILRMKVKYLVTIYVLIDLARLILDKNAFTALVEICCGLCGLLYVRYAARRGLNVSLAEKYFGVRNDYYRWKRRRAARKFEVYMRKQDREVHFDNEGRYISPEDERRDPRDRKWMN